MGEGRKTGTKKKVLEQYAQTIREKEDLENRIRLIDLEVRDLESECRETVSAGRKGKRSLGRAEVEGRSRAYSEKKTSLLQLRMSYQKMQERLSAMALDVEEYIQSIDDSRMRQIMRLRYAEVKNGKQMTWREVAQRMGETEDSCRKAHDRWLG